MRLSSCLIIAAGLILLAQLPVLGESVRNKLSADAAKIETLKQHDIVWEDQDGFLRTHSKDPEIILLVNEENDMRRKQYQEVVKQKCLEKWPGNRRMRNICTQKMLQSK